MEIAQSLVAEAYQSMGYFVIEGVEVGHREIDLLAIKTNGKNKVIDKLHIEVTVSINPVGLLRAESRIGKLSKNANTAAMGYINKKFNYKATVATVRKYFGSNYRKVLIHGKVNKIEQLETFKRNGIQTTFISDLVRKVKSESNLTRGFKRTVGIINVVGNFEVK